MKQRYIDIGLNLASPKFSNDWRDVIERARAVGVERFILTGTTIDGSKRSRDLAAEFAENTGYFTAGVHPHYSGALDRNGVEKLRKLLRDPLAVAVGETGLDYFRDLTPRLAQQDSFRRHIELACWLNKPMFLHERGAHNDFLRILDEFGAALPKCVVHCFTGTEEQAREYIRRGFYLGVTGWVGQSKRNKDLLASLPLIPRDKLLLETDAPYLAPDRYKYHTPGRNEPDAMPVIAELVAHKLGVGLHDLANAVHDNSLDFFRLNQST